jgi:subtilisin family serine protease
MKAHWTTAALVVAFLLFAGPAPGALCVVVDPLLELGCPAAQQPSTSTSQQSAPQAQENVRLSSTEPRYDPRRLAVTFRRGTTSQAARATIDAGGTTLVQAVPKINAYLVDVDPDRRAAALAYFDSSPRVASAGRELMAEALDTTPDDNGWPQQDGLRVAGFPKAWDVTRGSSRIVVAVVDTGVDAAHPDLRGAVVQGHDFVNGDADAADDHGHGTAVAGVIAARSNNREGGAGICWRCSVMPVKVLDASGSGNDTVIAAGIVWAADHGAQVINMSLGGPGTSAELSNAIGYAVGKGVIVVAAAGNSGTTTQFFPAADPRAISVGASTVADRRYSWSNFGPWVRVAAPGCNFAPVRGGGYGTFCGTSSATPLVAGLIALELSAEPTATAADIQQALVRAAVPLPDFVQYGRIDAGKTLSLLRPARANAVFRGTIRSRARVRSFRVVAGAGELSANLQFTGNRRLMLQLGSLARVAGTSPLELRRSVPAGTYTLCVSGRGSATFVLTVSYALPADRE